MPITLQGSATPVSNNNKIAMENWLKEIDDYYKKMTEFNSEEPDEIFRLLSAWTARASHIRSLIVRSGSNLLQGFRTGQIDPFIQECDRQFKIWSRVVSVENIDYGMGRGVV